MSNIGLINQLTTLLKSSPMDFIFVLRPLKKILPLTLISVYQMTSKFKHYNSLTEIGLAYHDDWSLDG